MRLTRAWWTAGLLVAAVVLGGEGGGDGTTTCASAIQEPAAQGQAEFVPARELPTSDTLPGGGLVVAAYMFVWLALIVYVWTIWRRLGKVEKELAELRRTLDRTPPAS